MSGPGEGRRAAWLPVRDHRFWVVQALVAVVFLLHELADGGLGTRAVRWGFTHPGRGKFGL